MQFGGVLKGGAGGVGDGAGCGRATVQSLSLLECVPLSSGPTAEISTLIPFLIPGKTGIWWEGNAAERTLDGRRGSKQMEIQFGMSVCEREKGVCGA